MPSAIRPAAATVARGLARLGTLPAPALAAAVAMLPLLPGLLLGQSYYFRDLARYWIPFRVFLFQGLRAGELRLWDPYVHEGTRGLPLLFYPPDLLTLLDPGPFLISLVLALHVGLAAGALAALVRSLGGGRTAAVAGGVMYALSGYGLSLLNLDIALRAFAWAPLVVLTLRRAVAGGAAEVGVAAATAGIALTTLSPEILLQGFLLALFLSPWPPRPRPLANAAAALSLGAAIAAAPLLLQASLIPGSARGALLPTEDNLTDALPAVAWLQVVVANLLGDLSRLGTAWWGYEHFRRGFPYVVSLYLGPTALVLAGVGLARSPWLRRRLALALGVALLVVAAAGSSALGPRILELVPPLRLFRYPVKIFFAVQLSVALLAAGGVQALARGRSGWRAFGAAAATLGVVLCLPRVAWSFDPERVAAALAGVFPSGMADVQRAGLTGFVVGDAALGGGLALASALVAALVLAGRLRPGPSSALLVAILAADLLRAGAGLNPSVGPDFYSPSPEARALFDEVAAEDGRFLTCDLSVQRGYAAARGMAGPRGATFVFAAMVESATPYTNTPLGIPTALSQDLYSLVPVERPLEIEELACRSFAALEARARLAGVTHVISADPLPSDALTLDTILRPPRLAPLALFVYRLKDPLPRYAVADRALPAADRDTAEAEALSDPAAVWIEGLEKVTRGATGRVLDVRRETRHIRIEVTSSAPAQLVVREGFDSAWRASVDGEPAPVRRANGRHMAVPVPAGTSVVELRLRPAVLLPGLAVSLIGALSAAALVLWPRRRRAADD